MLTLAFLIGTSDEPKRMGMVLDIKSEYFNYSKLVDALESVIRHTSMTNKFDLPLAEDTVSFTIDNVNGVPIGCFVYHRVERYDWVDDLPDAFAAYNLDMNVTRVDPEALAAIVKNTFEPIGLGDLSGEWKGVIHRRGD